MHNFKTFSLHPVVLKGVAAAGYTAPTPIQIKAIPEVMNHRDVMGLAQTGTGKTAAFALPILHRLMNRTQKGVGALILAPTRELAQQIHDSIETLGGATGLRSAVVYGGVGINPQITALKKADIVVACPGRLLDHIGRKTVDFSHLSILVLDEADQMFDMGFFPDIRRILGHLPRDSRQTLLFSATMPKEIRRLANDILKNPTTVEIGTSAPAETVRHALYPVSQHLKTALLLRLLGETATGSVLVFTRTKYRAKSLGEKLSKAGYPSTSLQGNLSQNRRQAALDGFRSGKIQILVATDIAARGIDVSDISHVINYDVPTTPEAYIHRIGRTGRAERNGEAFTLVTEEDNRMVRAINAAIGRAVEKRTLADFDYAVPPTAQTRDTRPPLRQSRLQAPSRPSDRRKPGQSGTRKRDGKGAFACMAPKRTGGRPHHG